MSEPEETEARFWANLRNNPTEQDRLGMFFTDDGRQIRGVFKPGSRARTLQIIKDAEENGETWVRGRVRPR